VSSRAVSKNACQARSIGTERSRASDDHSHQKGTDAMSDALTTFDNAKVAFYILRSFLYFAIRDQTSELETHIDISITAAENLAQTMLL